MPEARRQYGVLMARALLALGMVLTVRGAASVLRLPQNSTSLFEVKMLGLGTLMVGLGVGLHLVRLPLWARILLSILLGMVVFVVMFVVIALLELI